MLIFLTNEKEFKRSTISNFKKIEVDVKGWYCPINGKIFMIGMDGIIRSGVCGENKHTTEYKPWWGLKELVLNNSNNNICTLKRGCCFCGSDIQIHKAINKNTYDWFLNNSPLTDNNLSFATKDDKIIAVGVSKQIIPTEVHFHIGKLCNFDCRYCPPAVHDNFSPHSSLSKFKLGLDLLNPHMQKYRELYITGGEPTLNPQLSEMVQYGKELNFTKIGVNTNGTASLTKLTNLLQLGVYLNISFHLSRKKHAYLEGTLK